MNPGDIIDGRFVLESMLGRGGMGTVWRARQVPLGRTVALKLLRTQSLWQQLERYCSSQVPAKWLLPSRSRIPPGSCTATRGVPQSRFRWPSQRLLRCRDSRVGTASRWSQRQNCYPRNLRSDEELLLR